MRFDWWSVLLLGASLQGILLALARAIPSGRRRPADAPLAALMLAFAIPIGEHGLIHQGTFLVDGRGYLIFVTTPFLFLPGALFCFYARALRSRPVRRRTAVIHLIPALLVVVNNSPAYWFLAGRPFGRTTALASGQLFPLSGYVEMGLEIALLGAYLLLSQPVLRAFEADARAHLSRSAAVHADWLRRFSWVLLAVAAMNFVALIGMATIRYVRELEYAMAFALALSVQFVGFSAVREPMLFLEGVPGDEPTDEDADETKRYAKSGLSSEMRGRYRERLVNLMATDRPWLDENLRLGDLAKRAGIRPAHVSEVLSQELGTSFFDFVNGYRVEEAKRRLADTEADASTLEIALECGFSSKSSFYRVFKRFGGTTPSKFARESRAGGSPADRG